MASIQDDRGYNQGFEPTKALEIRTERRCDYIISRISTKKSTKILEVGCGTGEISYLLAKRTNANVLGIDICKPFIEQAKKKFKLKNLRYEVLDFNDPAKIKSRKFDYIVGNGILHHLYQSLDESLVNMHRLLNNSGKIVFLEPNIWNPYCFTIFNFGIFRRMTRLEPGEMAFTKGFIAKKLRKAGFSDVVVEYRDFLLPNAPSFLIKPSILAGKILERIPLIRMGAQSIFISARR